MVQKRDFAPLNCELSYDCPTNYSSCYCFRRCTSINTTHEPQHPKRTCVKHIKKDNYGYAMVGSCPAYNADETLESLCTSISSETDLFGMLPVSDAKNNTAYKNEFCARCNQVTNLTYWKFLATCEGFSSHDIPKNRSLMLAFIMKECKWHFQPPSVRSDYLRVCLAIKQNCQDSDLADEEPVLRDLCSFYAFPVCGDFHTKNPHCSICKRKGSSCPCKVPVSGGPEPPAIPPLNILFDFSSTTHSVQVGDSKTVVKNRVCAKGFVFDPFNEKCVRIHVSMSSPEIALRNISGSKDKTHINCSNVEMNISSVSLLSNGSIWIPLHQRIYSKERYVINGSLLLLCAGFKRVYTETESLVSMKISPLQILTYIGGAISIISLISLLSIYIALPELRTLPGKNLMSLSFAMLLYHIFFLLTGQTNKPNLCMAVSALLHYFLLSSFCWMGVMAFDVAWTFGGRGN